MSNLLEIFVEVGFIESGLGEAALVEHCDALRVERCLQVLEGQGIVEDGPDGCLALNIQDHSRVHFLRVNVGSLSKLGWCCCGNASSESKGDESVLHIELLCLIEGREKRGCV